ncbi:MAG TPA: MBL fold metallo-hydrolase [Allosphingosinicella sp.]|nr:MBL fold metallo-hydrolase [Allosphingosinicella sp.]
MFKLEALPARHGDCLLLHWGSDGDRRVALIDGGPSGTYPAVLKPRLAGLAGELGVERVQLELMMLSHIDDDHINGLLALADDIEEGNAPADVLLLWHNSLEGLLEGKLPEPANSPATASVLASFGTAARGGDEWAKQVLASVPQGQHLHAFAKRQGLDITMNDPYQPLVMLRDGMEPAEIEGLELVVIAPDAEAVEKLRKAWKKNRKEGITAAYNDRSPYNLSSIVVVARFGGKTMLLTGDALGNEVMDGLKKQGLLDAAGKAHFDLIKLPHHGSQNNLAPDFFENITADIYLVSGDHVKFPNPHPNAMGWLKDARGDDDYAIYCTYDLDYMHDIFGDKLRVPAAGETGVTASLD